MNKVTIFGRLTRDPEVRFTPNGTAVLELSLASNRKFRTNGELKEETIFVDVTFWGKQAEIVGEYCSKGKQLLVFGRLKLDTWENIETGKKQSKLSVVCEDFQLLGGGDKKSSEEVVSSEMVSSDEEMATPF